MPEGEGGSTFVLKGHLYSEFTVYWFLEKESTK